MAIRKIDTNIGTVPTWGDEDFDANVHENFTSLKNIVPKINNTVDDIDLTVNEMNILKNQAENVTTTASSSASLASQKASEASNSANQALIYKNQIQGFVIPPGTSYSVEQINTHNVAMTKAQFNGIAEERKANIAGSGFENFGQHRANDGKFINQGLWTLETYSNYFTIGENNSPTGVSKTNQPYALINGVRLNLTNVNTTTLFENNILLSTAPNIYPHDTVLTTEQINSGVIKHADASNSGLIANGKFDTDTSGWTYTSGVFTQENGKLKIGSLSGEAGRGYQVIPTVVGKTYTIEINMTNISLTQLFRIFINTSNSTSSPIASINYDSDGRKSLTFVATSTTTYIIMLGQAIASGYGYIDNIAVYPLDAISRSDLVFLESWHEDISEKNFIYPLGNVQYLGSNTDGLVGIVNGSFSGYETYSLFGNWQTPSALIGKGYVWSNLTEAQKRAFIANPENNCYLDGDKTIQVRYRIRVVQGLGDITDNPFSWVGGYLGTIPLNVSAQLFVAKGKKVSIPNEYKTYANRLSEGTYSLNPANSLQDIGIRPDIACVIQGYSETNVAYEGKCFALPIALINRRNQGMYHNVFNPNGTKLASDGLDCFRTSVSFTSISDCFDPAKLLTASGYIGTVSGRPDGLFYDQVHEGDITDLRNSSKKIEDYNRLINREFNKLVAGTTRGKEGEWTTVTTFGTNVLLYDNGGISVSIYDPNFLGTLELSIGDNINVAYYNGSTFIYDRATVTISSNQSLIVNAPNIAASISGGVLKDGIKFCIYSKKTSRTKSNTLLHCDIIGSPANYPTAWKESGVFGTPLIVAEDGTSLLPDGVKDTFKLSRKANGTPILALRSTDNGATWTSFTPTFSTATNAITLTDEPAGNLVVVYYQTKTSTTTPTVNSEVVEIGEVLGINGLANGALISTLIGKVPTANTAPYSQRGYSVSGYRIDMSTFKFSTTATEIPTHSTLSLAGGAVGVPAVKMLPYLTRVNGKAYLNLVFKEMKHNGTSWGDDSKFNIVDNVSATTDNNAQTVLVGQKTVELPYFIGADE